MGKPLKAQIGIRKKINWMPATKCSGKLKFYRVTEEVAHVQGNVIPLPQKIGIALIRSVK